MFRQHRTKHVAQDSFVNFLQVVMFLAELRPFRMAILAVAHTSCTNRNAAVSLSRNVYKQVCPMAYAKHAFCYITRLDRSLNPLHILPTPHRLCRPAAAPVPAPPPTEQSLLYVRIGVSVLCFCASIFFLSLVFLVRVGAHLPFAVFTCC